MAPRAYVVQKWGQDAFPGRFHIISQISGWTSGGWRAASPREQTGRVLRACLWRTDPCRVHIPLFLSSLSPRSPLATMLHWTFARILSPCFGFFSHRWITLYLSWLKISILPILKPSWISSLGYGDVHEMYYWLRTWPTYFSLLSLLLSFNQYSH